MKLKIIKIVDNNMQIKVLCRTNYGDVSLFWMEGNPIEGNVYDVELENDKVLSWSKDIILTEEQLVICDDDYKIKIVGVIESVDDDGYMVLKLGESIIAFMTQGIPVECGMKVKIVIEKLEAYPIEY